MEWFYPVGGPIRQGPPAHSESGRLMPQQLLLLELNEINFDYVASYVGRGGLPNLGRLIRRNGVARTVSEQRYEDLEPWIQWVTAHTGMPLAAHGVFRLGDIVHKDLPQVWEQLEGHGLSVGAISPMNASNRLRQAAFFVPDPWTATPPTATARLTALYQGIVQAVNENAQSKVSRKSLAGLLTGFASYARPANYGTYLRLAATSPRCPWRKALVLDLLLADVFVREVRRHVAGFREPVPQRGRAHPASLPVLVRLSTKGRTAIPTGTCLPARIPCTSRTRSTTASSARSSPRSRMRASWSRPACTRIRTIASPTTGGCASMRRSCRGSASSAAASSRACRAISSSSAIPLPQAARAEARLARATAADGAPLFAIDNRGSDLFVELVYAGDIAGGFEFSIDGETFTGLDRDVAFVALKNGRHNGIGYFIDSAASPDALPAREFPLAEVHARILDAFNAAGCDTPTGSVAAAAAGR